MWWPGAVRMELQPESDAQPAIRPTQLIFHSEAAPWDEKRLLEYWQQTNLEAHFGVDFDGSAGQYIGTQTRADANAGANLRADGTGAVSVESASNTESTDPWTDEQIEVFVRLGAWMHEEHAVPLRICRSHSDPGYGYHSLFPQWSTGGTACPGPARIKQFRDRVFPGIVARATGETTVTLTQKEIDAVASATAGKVLAGIAKAAWLTDGVVGVPAAWTTPANPEWMPASILTDIGGRVRTIEASTAALIASGAAQDAVLALVAKGGTLTAAEVKAAAEAGAKAALDQLGDALQTPGG